MSENITISIEVTPEEAKAYLKIYGGVDPDIAGIGPHGRVKRRLARAIEAATYEPKKGDSIVITDAEGDDRTRRIVITVTDHFVITWPFGTEMDDEGMADAWDRTRCTFRKVS